MIDWSRPAGDVYNLIRGCNPQPGAHTTRNGERLGVFDSRRASGDADAAPGTVLAVSDDGIEVAAAEGSILVQRVQPTGARKLPAAEYAAEAGLSAGEVLGA